MDFSINLRNHIRARYSIVQVVTFEETRALAEIARISQDLKHEFYVWSASSGLLKDGKSAAERSADLRVAIDFCEERARTKEPFIFVFLDASTTIAQNGNPVYRRRLKDFAINIRTHGYRANCILLGPSSEIPLDLQKEITLLDFPIPDRAMVKSTISSFVAAHKANTRLTIDVGPATLDRLTEAAVGLTLTEIESCLSKALVDDLRLDGSDVSVMIDEKQQIIRKSGILDYIDASALSLDNVGGLETLKRWLESRSIAFGEAAKAFGLAPPKGVLLTGIPGCGKSLTAKCVAASWRVPLLKLDMGKVFHGVVGSSEANIRHALATAEAIAPAVLWIDEIEKGLGGSAGGGGDGGTAVRVFGTLLTWMQDKSSPVFVLATANDISGMPPELLRKGRFDEIFFVDLPSASERAAIITMQIRTLGRDPSKFDISKLASLSGELCLGDGIRLSGAELEAWVKDAMHEAYKRRLTADPTADLEMADLEQTIVRIVPMAQMSQTEIAKLRQWGSDNAVSASRRDPSPTAAGPESSVIDFGGRILDF